MRILRFVLRRLVLLVPVLAGVATLTFVLAWVATGGHLEQQYLDDADRLDDRRIEELRRLHGFDRPAPEQLLGHFARLLRGDLGHSTSVDLPVAEVIRTRFPASLELAVAALALAVGFGVPLGVAGAVGRDRSADHLGRLVAVAGASLPVFWLGLVLQLVFAYLPTRLGLPALPLEGRFDPLLGPAHPSLGGGPTGLLVLDTALAGDLVALGDVLAHLLLPASTLALVTVASIVRMTRASMLEELGKPYVAAARSRGLSEPAVVLRHALRNALLPTTTVIGLAVGSLVGGAVVTETVFQWPGIGRWATRALLSVDTAAVLGFVTLAALAYVVSNLVVDVIYAVLDPRVRR